MAQAYTPGLTVSDGMVLHKERRLPLPGEVLVEVGDAVEADTVVARTELPGKVHLVNIAGALSVPETEVGAYLRVPVGESVQERAVLAETKGLLGLFKSQCRAPATGTVESISTVTGQAVLREPPTPLAVPAYVRGHVVRVFPQEGVLVETYAAFVQGILGVGGEAVGELALAVHAPDVPLRPADLRAEHRGKVVVGGCLASADVVRQAREVGATALVTGGMDDADLRSLLGYELGVAITGGEDVGLTVIITEGFGSVPMAEHTFSLLRAHVGRLASVNGATQIRAGVLRPEIILPLAGAPAERAEREAGRLEVGATVRVIREPYFGQVADVVELPVPLHQLETEARVRVVTVRLRDGSTAAVPRANVELIEQAAG
jgi:hypothetical protein